MERMVRLVQLNDTKDTGQVVGSDHFGWIAGWLNSWMVRIWDFAKGVLDFSHSAGSVGVRYADRLTSRTF